MDFDPIPPTRILSSGTYYIYNVYIYIDIDIDMDCVLYIYVVDWFKCVLSLSSSPEAVRKDLMRGILR